MISAHTSVRLLTTLLGLSLLSTSQASVTFGEPPVQIAPGVNVVDGTNVTLTANLTFAMPTSRVLIQWQRNGTPLMNGGRVKGVTTNLLTIKGVQKGDQGSYSYTVTRIENGTTQLPVLTSDAVDLYVKVRPIITSQSSGGSYNQDAALSLSVEVSPDSEAPLIYEWQHNNQPIDTDLHPSAATANFLIPARDSMNPDEFPGVQWRDAGSYRVKISNGTGITIFSKPIPVTVASAAVILTDLPSTVYVPTKGKVKLAIGAGGTPKLAYQWSIDGEGNVAKGGNAASIAIAGTPENEGKVYRVTVTNAATDGDHPPALSLGATVRVINKLVAPLVTGSLGGNTYQKSFTFDKGTTPVLEVLASTDNTGDLQYQWQKDGRDISDSAAVGGTNARQLTFSDLSWADRGVYRCIVRNQVSVVTSKTFALGVNSPPVILTEPAASNVGITGGKAVLSVVAGGSGKLSYQWYKKDPGGDIPLPKATSNKLTLSKLLKTDVDGDDYYCEVSNAFTPTLGGGVSTSSAIANLVVYDPVKIITHPQVSAVGVRVGGTLSLSVGITGDDPVVYEWYFNKKILTNGLVGSATISGANTASLQIENITESFAGSFSCVVRNAKIPGTEKYLANVTSKAAKVKIVIPPGILQDTTATPASPIEEESVTLSVVGSGSAPLKYQWQKHNGGTWTDIKGKTAAKMTIAKVQLSDSAQYRCVVNNALNEPATSTPLNLQVQEIPEAIITDFVPAKARGGEKVRVLGTNIKYVKAAKIGELNASFVIESPTSMLITVPGGAPLESVPEEQRKIQLQTKNYTHISAQPFTRTLNYANNGYDNATILTGVRIIAEGDNTDFTSSEGGGFVGDVQTACYWWTAPKTNNYAVVASCFFDASLMIYRGTPFALGVREKAISFINRYTESLTFNAVEGQNYVIVVAGNTDPLSFGPAEGAFRLDIFATREIIEDTGSMAMTVGPPSAADLEIQADAIAVEGGQMQSEFKEFRLGGVTGGDDPIVLTELVQDVPADAPVVTTSFQMILETPGEGVSGDGFGLLLYGEDDAALAGIWIHARDGRVSITDDQRDYVPSEQVLLSGAPHQVELTVDRVAGTWSATLDGAPLVNATHLPTAALFKELSPVWQASSDGSPPSTLVIRRFEVRAD
jgi:hypothetical protein